MKNKKNKRWSEDDFWLIGAWDHSFEMMNEVKKVTDQELETLLEYNQVTRSSPLGLHILGFIMGLREGMHIAETLQMISENGKGDFSNESV